MSRSYSTGPGLSSQITDADNTSIIATTAVIGLNYVYDPVGANWDRAVGAKLHDLDTGAGQEWNLGVNIRTGGSGGSTEIFTSSSPAYVQLRNTATYSDSTTGSDFGPVYSFNWIYNELSATWYRERQAQLTYGGLGLSALGLPITAIAGHYFNGTIDQPANNTFHHPQITAYRAFHVNDRDSSGNELIKSQDTTLLASASRTTTQTSSDIINYSGLSALIVILDMTVVGTGSVTLSIDGKDPASGKYYNILTGAAITTNSTNIYRIGRNLAAVANTTAQDYIPRTIRIVVTANNANAATYSVGYSWVA